MAPIFKLPQDWQHGVRRIYGSYFGGAKRNSRAQETPGARRDARCYGSRQYGGKVGYKLRGGPGALVSAIGVILPSFTLIVALSAAYFRWGQIPAVNKLFLGFIPAVTAVIVHAA